MFVPYPQSVVNHTQVKVGLQGLHYKKINGVAVENDS